MHDYDVWEALIPV